MFARQRLDRPGGGGLARNAVDSETLVHPLTAATAMPKKTKRTIRTRKGIREYTHLGCPLTKNRSAWCFRLCVPGADGNGPCGRLAPHGLTGRTQHAIEAHNRKLRAGPVEALEAACLPRTETEGDDAGVRIVEGDAEVLPHLPPPERRG